MEWVETTARTVEEAKDHALDQLGVDESDAEFEIMEEPRPGLFGRVRGEARVRARVRPTQPRPKAERRERRRKRDDAPTPPSNGETEPTPRTHEPGATRPVTAPGDESNEETLMDDAENGTADVAEGATSFLTGLLEAFGLEGEVSVREPAEGEIEVSVEGAELGLLVGPKGQTLVAIQDLTRLVAQRHVGPGSPRLGVDVGGYRQRRVEALQRFSRQLAQQVVEAGAAKSLEPMTAADRKVVHDALNDVDGVSTLSEGEEPTRRVVIVPSSGT